MSISTHNRLLYEGSDWDFGMLQRKKATPS